MAGTHLLEFKGIVHCHSLLSHDSPGSFEEIAAAAAHAGIDFVVMTDHVTDVSITTGKRGMDGNTLFMVGAEMQTPAGTLLAFPLESNVAFGTTEEMIGAIHSQGGLALVGHAEGFRAWDTPGLDGIEIYNLHAAALACSKVEIILRFLFTPVRSLLGTLTARPDDNLARLDHELARRHPFTPVGGTDAHNNLRFGPLGTLATYRELFLVLSTHVLATSLEPDALTEGFRLGRTFVVVDWQRDGSGFDFRAEAAGEVHVMGATVPASDDLVLSVQVPWPAEIRLLRDGQLVDSIFGTELCEPQPSPGIYRVECMLASRYPWIFSSSIRVQAPANDAL